MKKLWFTVHSSQFTVLIKTFFDFAVNSKP